MWSLWGTGLRFDLGGVEGVRTCDELKLSAVSSKLLMTDAANGVLF